MALSPVRRPGEPLSRFRLRYAFFAFNCSLGFAAALAVFLAARPAGGPSPLLQWFLFFLLFGLPLGLAMAAVSTVWFLVGALVARRLEQDPAARWRWLLMRLCLAGLVVGAACLFMLYWVFLGMATGRIPGLTSLLVERVVYVGADGEPLLFWASMAGWTAMGLGLPVFVLRRARLRLGL